MTTTRAEPTRLCRRPDLGVVGGVVTGIAEHTGLNRRVVGLVFILLTMAGGLGIALYGVYWIVLPAQGQPRITRTRVVRMAVIAVAGLVSLGALVWQLPSGGLVGPSLLACIGGAFIWRQATDPDRENWRRLGRTTLTAGSTDRAGRLRLLIGAVLVVVGGGLVLHRANVTAVRDGLLAMLVAAIGIALLTGPWWMRLVSQLGTERRERIRSQERADIAAHLHDSVLQTLALIQRNAESPREVTRLARGQERELRALLYADRTAKGQFSERLRTDAGEVEDAYAITVELVVVGDMPLDAATAAACAAAREALTNSAKHAKVPSVSLYAEVEPEAVSLYVRDRGVGFDPAEVADDRQGLRGSIQARVERHGGTATISSAPGEGTEVMIRMPRS